MTMKTPEMEVVRFNEADVIVASGIQSFALAKWKNGTNGDATVDGQGKSAAQHWLDNLGEGHTFQYQNGPKVSAKNLFDYEETGDIMDGVYTKVDGENNWWCQ